MNRQNLFSSLFFILLLVIAMVFVYGIEDHQIASPVEEAEEEVAEEPAEPEEEGEIYTGTAEGYGSDLTVEVEVLDGEILAVRVVEHSETEDLADPALEEVPARIVAEQSTDVDIVTGVTVTSEAIMTAVDAALADVDLEAPEPEEEPAEGEVYTGTAEGFIDDITVEVTVLDGEITGIEVIEHDETPEYFDDAVPEILDRIIAAQSTEVDIVTGATGTSEGIMAAVDAALADVDLEAPEPEEEPAELEEDVFRGTAEGYGSDLTVEVRVEEGLIKSIEVVEHSETEGFAEDAFEQVPASIIETQSTDVDTVSGVTKTSEAIMAAVDAALADVELETPEEEPDEEAEEAETRTITAVGEGYGGELQLEVTLENDEIIDIEILSHSETEGFAEDALEQVPASIIEAQSTDVDAVSGVTETSEAIMEAVESALEQ